MLIRRIVLSACALCIAIPSAASASAATDPPKPVGPYGITTTIDPSAIVKAKGPYGVTLKIDPQNLVKGKGPYGTTPTTYPPLADAKGPYGTTPTTYPPLAKAKGPYGTTIADPQNATRATTQAASASSYDRTNDWRAAAIAEAALLAALAVGSALVLSARRRAPRLGGLA